MDPQLRGATCKSAPPAANFLYPEELGVSLLLSFVVSLSYF